MIPKAVAAGPDRPHWAMRWTLLAFPVLIALSHLVPVAASLCEAVLLLLLGGLLLEAVFKAPRVRISLLLLLGFSALSILLSVLFGEPRPYWIVMAQALVNMKFFVFCLALAAMLENGWITRADLEWALSRLLLATLFFGALNILWMQGYYTTFDIREDIRGDLGIPRLGGIQFSPNNFGATIVFCLLALGLAGRAAGNWLQIGMLILVCSLFLLLSGSRTAMATALVFIAVWLSTVVRTTLLVRITLLSAAALLVLLLASLGSDQFIVEATLDNFANIASADRTSYIRGIIVYEGFHAAFTHFPFGWGLGNFGTILSVDSPVYTDIGLSNSVYLQEQQGIFDSNLASIAGELGFIGLAFHAILLWRLSTPLSAGSNSTRDQLIILLVIVVYALTTPLFMSDYLSVTSAMLVAFVRSRPAAGMAPPVAHPGENP